MWKKRSTINSTSEREELDIRVLVRLGLLQPSQLNHFRNWRADVEFASSDQSLAIRRLHICLLANFMIKSLNITPRGVFDQV
jgi:hypothetical protein